MAGQDERVAYLEGRMEDHTALIADIRSEMRSLRSDMRAEMTGFRSEMTEFRSVVRAEIRDLRNEMDRRFERVDQKFTWLVGMFVALLLGLVGLSVQLSRLQQL